MFNFIIRSQIVLMEFQYEWSDNLTFLSGCENVGSLGDRGILSWKDILPFERISFKLHSWRNKNKRIEQIIFLIESIPTVDFYLNNNVRYLYLLIESRIWKIIDSINFNYFA